MQINNDAVKLIYPLFITIQMEKVSFSENVFNFNYHLK